MEHPMTISERVRVRRGHNRASYDIGVIHAILDASPVCHVGCIRDGVPVVTPTTHWRSENRLYWHGSTASSSIRAQESQEVCVTITHFDGFVAARSAFHHSANYRSVMVFGRPATIKDKLEKEAVLKDFVGSLFPERWDKLRPMTAKELKATSIHWIPIDEASAKVRTGPPVDDDADVDWPIWAGVVPFDTEFKAPQADAGTGDQFDPPTLHRRLHSTDLRHD